MLKGQAVATGVISSAWSYRTVLVVGQNLTLSNLRLVSNRNLQCTRCPTQRGRPKKWRWWWYKDSPVCGLGGKWPQNLQMGIYWSKSRLLAPGEKSMFDGVEPLIWIKSEEELMLFRSEWLE